jgi:hypothetical protein
MIPAKRNSRRIRTERAALDHRVRQVYRWLNRGQWEKCFSVLDPKLQSKVDQSNYEQRLMAFKQTYGAIQPWHLRISLHLDGSANKRDLRPFAYVYLVWRDKVGAFHMFRERWVKDSNRWFTRVAGLVPNRQAPSSAQD